MKIVIEYNEKTGRMDMTHDGSNVIFVGVLEIAKHLAIQRNAKEGAPGFGGMDLTKVGGPLPPPRAG